MAKSDTGAEDNWISKEMFDRLGIEMHLLENRTSFLGASNQRIVPLGTARIKWTANSSQTLEDDFLITEEMPVDIILGYRLLQKYDIMKKSASFFVTNPMLVLVRNKHRAKGMC